MIAIKGIEKIPQTCSDCDLCRGHICKITGTDIIANPKGNCPLIEIVTCKDCKYNTNMICDIYGIELCCCEDDYYCADGERRE
jgi:hypothetical protein